MDEVSRRNDAIEAKHQPFLQLTECDRDPEAPSIHIWRDRYLFLPLKIYRTGVMALNLQLERLKDGHERPCTLHWNPYHGDLLLLRHKDDGSLERVEVPSADMNQLAGGFDANEVTVSDADDDWIWELSPGGTDLRTFVLPGRYQKLLQHGARYDLLWRGGEVPRWAWGSRRENLGLMLKERSQDLNAPKLILPGRCVYFLRSWTTKNEWPMRALREKEVGFEKANEEEDEWHRREQERLEALRRPPSPKAVTDEKRSPGTPVLRGVLECAPTITRSETITITLTITYEGVLDKECQVIPGEQIILHSVYLGGLGNFQKRLPGTAAWVNTVTGPPDGDSDEDPGGFPMFPDEEWEEVNVSTHKHFITLICGERWRTKCTFTAELSDPVGTEFRYRWLGVRKVDWWDFGSREDHASTKVHLPWFIDGAVKSGDCGDRARLVVPGLNSDPFSLVE